MSDLLVCKGIPVTRDFLLSMATRQVQETDKLFFNKLAEIRCIVLWEGKNNKRNLTNGHYCHKAIVWLVQTVWHNVLYTSRDLMKAKATWVQSRRSRIDGTFNLRQPQAKLEVPPGGSGQVGRT